MRHQFKLYVRIALILLLSFTLLSDQLIVLIKKMDPAAFAPVDF